jgi:hypothetical protein
MTKESTIYGSSSFFKQQVLVFTLHMFWFVKQDHVTNKKCVCGPDPSIQYYRVPLVAKGWTLRVEASELKLSINPCMIVMSGAIWPRLCWCALKPNKTNKNPDQISSARDNCFKKIKKFVPDLIVFYLQQNKSKYQSHGQIEDIIMCLVDEYWITRHL